MLTQQSGLAGEHPENPRLNAVHFPADRRLRVWVRRRELMLAAALLAAPVVAAWVQFATVGLPDSSLAGQSAATNAQATPGFPVWTRGCHYINLLLLVTLLRSGLSILFDHPRLYWNDHCTPGSEWMRFTPIQVPADRIWTAKDDARYVSPWLALPGYRHTVGIARHWHFLSLPLWLANGLAFVILLFATDHWRRLVPTSSSFVSEAWGIFVHYATVRLPDEPNGFFRYNALQQLAYFGVVFAIAPLSLLTGMAMSPAVDNRFRWYPRLFGGRQCARSIHFLLVVAYIGFLVVHVAMV
ncbi:MAG: cytochrome b/b6 domain-containing protein [Planctomycetaceae bacterium]